MPKIKITERDLTGTIQPSQISNTVFVPIQRRKDDDMDRDQAFMHVKSVDMLNAYLSGSDAVYLSDAASNNEQDLNGDLGYKLCKHLLNIGLDVLVTVVDSVDDIDWESLKDKGLYDVRFITLGAMTDSTGAGMADAKSCAETRGDCTALFNLPVGWSYAISDQSSGAGGGTENTENIEGESGEEEGNSPNENPLMELADEDTPTSVVEKIKNFFTTAGASEYCACFAPNFKSINSDLAIKTEDALNSTEYRKVYTTDEEEVPAAFGYLFAYAASIKNNPEWYAVAGFQRGFIPELTDVSYELSTAEMLTLQCRDAASAKLMYELDTETDNVGTAINPIAYIRPAGYIIYGNRTYRYNDAAKKTTAQSFLNVRNMISAVKKKLWDASRKFTFEPNNELLWVRFKSFVTPYLDQLQAGNGIIGYKFDRLATTAKARLKCRLVIIPVEAVEDFEIEVTLADDLTVVE